MRHGQFDTTTPGDTTTPDNKPGLTPGGPGQSVRLPSRRTGSAGSAYGLTGSYGSAFGSYAATPLSSAASWSVGLQSGSFDWSYAVPTAPVGWGSGPTVSIDYSSAAIDGLTFDQNAQAPSLGQGWNLSAGGYIERSYKSCGLDNGIPGIERSVQMGHLTPYQINGALNWVSFLSGTNPAQISVTTGDLNDIQLLVNYFDSKKGVGVNIDDPVISITRVTGGKLLETYHTGRDDYRQIGEFTGVDAFVVQISTRSGIGLAASAGVKGDPSQSGVTNTETGRYLGVGHISSSEGVETFIYIADFGNYRDLIENPKGVEFSQSPTFEVQIRSAA
jgi:hypothetical protein